MQNKNAKIYNELLKDSDIILPYNNQTPTPTTYL